MNPFLIKLICGGVICIFAIICVLLAERESERA